LLEILPFKKITQLKDNLNTIEDMYLISVAALRQTVSSKNAQIGRYITAIKDQTKSSQSFNLGGCFYKKLTRVIVFRLACKNIKISILMKIKV